VTPPPGKPVVLVDGRLARRRRTGIARVINETRTALLMDPPADMEVVFTEGPPALPTFDAAVLNGGELEDAAGRRASAPGTCR
jgi:hypothetical protein